MTIVDPPRSTTIDVTKGRVDTRIDTAGTISIQAGEKVRIAGRERHNGTALVTIEVLQGTVSVLGKSLTAAKSTTVAIPRVCRTKRMRRCAASAAF